MAVIVELPEVSVFAEAEIFRRGVGWAWKAAIIDRQSREAIERVEMAFGVHWDLRIDAEGDAEDKLSARLLQIQAERNAARAAARPG